MRGILMVATEPVAARRRWCLASEWWSEAFRIDGDGLGEAFDGVRDIAGLEEVIPRPFRS